MWKYEHMKFIRLKQIVRWGPADRVGPIFVYMFWACRRFLQKSRVSIYTCSFLLLWNVGPNHTSDLIQFIRFSSFISFISFDRINSIIRINRMHRRDTLAAKASHTVQQNLYYISKQSILSQIIRKMTNNYLQHFIWDDSYFVMVTKLNFHHTKHTRTNILPSLHFPTCSSTPHFLEHVH